MLEVSGMEILDHDRLAVATRKGEVWIIEGAYADPPKDLKFKLFANALHEPLGLLKDGDSLLTMQRSELTRFAIPMATVSRMNTSPLPRGGTSAATTTSSHSARSATDTGNCGSR